MSQPKYLVNQNNQFRDKNLTLVLRCRRHKVFVEDS